MRSGAPFSVTTGRDNNLDGNNNDRANLVGNPVPRSRTVRADAVDRHVVQHARRSRATAAGGQDGTVGTQHHRRAGHEERRISASSATSRMRETLRLQFRTEMTNAFNLVNYLPFATNWRLIT